MIDELVLVGRLVIATILGGLVGYERQHRHKTAGIRTHLLVCLGSCLVMVLSYNIYSEVEGMTNADPARLAAQVVSGIGFLGAGAILKEGLTVKGLTTAASLWVVAAIGLAVGSGYYLAAVASATLSIVALNILPRIDRLYKSSPYDAHLLVLSKDMPGQVGKIGSYLGSIDVRIIDIKMESLPNKELGIELVVNCPNKHITHEIVKNMLELEGIISVTEEK